MKQLQVETNSTKKESNILILCRALELANSNTYVKMLIKQIKLYEEQKNKLFLKGISCFQKKKTKQYNIEKEGLDNKLAYCYDELEKEIERSFKY